MNVSKSLGIEKKIKTLDSYYRDDLYNQAIVERIKEALNGRDPSTIDMVFSAHGLPKKVIERGYLYQKHIKGNLYFVRKELLKQGIKFRKTHLAYQSRLGPMEWIRPYLEDKLETLKNRDVIIYPLAFTADNSETECELDIEYREKSEHIPLASYTVAKTVNDHPLFIDELCLLANKISTLPN
jgi:ferrochelatase